MKKYILGFILSIFIIPTISLANEIVSFDEIVHPNYPDRNKTIRNMELQCGYRYRDDSSLNALRGVKSINNGELIDEDFVEILEPVLLNFRIKIRSRYESNPSYRIGSNLWNYLDIVHDRLRKKYDNIIRDNCTVNIESLGVTVYELKPEVATILSPIGLQTGDKITSINGERISHYNIREIISEIAEVGTITYIRNGDLISEQIECPLVGDCLIGFQYDYILLDKFNIGQSKPYKERRAYAINTYKLSLETRKTLYMLSHVLHELSLATFIGD